MSQETIFFSYSRDDSEFVLNLAKNLRNAGANIWLDQLDIKPGTRWDKSIEKALDTSNTLLVILSKTSVESTNVMDEVSFALEEQKTVVPVLLEQCDIPFRLRRLQFADFSTDKTKGLKTLAEALHLDYSVASKLTDTANEDAVASKKEVVAGKKIKEEVSDQKKEIKKEQSSTNKKDIKTATSNSSPSKEKKKSKAPLYIIGTILILAAVGYFMKDAIFPDKDQIAWDEVLSKDEVKEYEFYLRTFKDGKYAKTAQDSINSKAVALAKQQELEAWNTADKAKTVSGYNTYLKKYENGKHAAEARTKIKELEDNIEKVNADNAAWNAAKDSGSVNILASYMSNTNVIGAHKEEALSKIKETGHEHWLYYGRPQGDRMNNEVFDIHFREGISVEADMKPEIGDILVATKSYRTYLRVGAETAEGKSGKTVTTGNKVLIVDIDERPKATFVKVRYD